MDFYADTFEIDPTTTIVILSVTCQLEKKTGSVGCNYIVLVLRKVNLFYIGS